MSKFWLVAKNEYRKRAGQRSFLIGTLLIPIAIVVLFALTIFIVERSTDRDPIGFVDHSGLLAGQPAPELDEDSVEIIAYPDEQAAQAALEARQIQAYYVIPESYPEVLEVDLYFWEDWPAGAVQRDFDDYIRAVVLAEDVSPVQARLSAGTEVIYQSADKQREFSGEAGFVTIFFPLVVAMFFLFAVMSASGYFLQAVTDEKENRTMEIVITSMSPGQLIAGKSLGLVAVVVTQIVIWLSTIAIGWVVAQQFIPEIQELRLPWDSLIVFAVFFLPALGLIAALMIAIGGAVTEYQEGQQISGVLNLFFIAPLFLTGLVFANPNSPVMVFFSFFPTTSFLTIILRWGFTIIPFWQLALSWLILVACTLAALWAAARILRLGMLRYGQHLTVKSILASLRTIRQGESA
ncbi:MAG: ABC transporter permease [Anaerolineales bacterium]|nr:ABC transporter permease [Anaerolineales bacterium]